MSVAVITALANVPQQTTGGLENCKSRQEKIAEDEMEQLCDGGDYNNKAIDIAACPYKLTVRSQLNDLSGIFPKTGVCDDDQ